MNFKPNTEYGLDSLKTSYIQKPIVKESTLSGRLAGNDLNAAQTSMAGNVVGGIADVASTAIGAGFQSNEMNSAREEARTIAEQNRTDVLGQQTTNINLKKQMQEQEVKRFELNKLQQNETLRHNTWLADFEKALDNTQNLQDSVKNLFGDANRSEAIKNVLLSVYRRKQ